MFTNSIKKFFILNDKGEKLGKIIYSYGNFEVKVESREDKEFLEKFLKEAVENGLCFVGEIILKDPIKPGDSLFFQLLKENLAVFGYVLIEKE